MNLLLLSVKMKRYDIRGFNSFSSFLPHKIHLIIKLWSPALKSQQLLISALPKRFNIKTLFKEKILNSVILKVQLSY